MATKSGLPPSSISHFEAGSRKPSFDNLRRLAVALEVTTDFLVGRVGEPDAKAEASPLYRDFKNLSGRDRELTREFMKMLAGRARSRAVTRNTRVWLAARKAESFLKDRGITELPVDVIAIAESLEIVVQAKPEAARGVSGMLVRQGDNFGILYATHISSVGFQRFSIAHELGHYLLDGHIDHVFPDGGTVHESRAGFTSGDRYELEADHFATGLLMPASLFDRAASRRGVGLEAVEQLATLCETSLTATAIRYASRASTSVAVVVSTGGIIDYCVMSESLREMLNLQWLRKGQPLPSGSETERFNRSPDNVARGERAEVEADLREWFGGERELTGLEEVVGLGSYGRTLTVLSTDVLPDDEDEDEDADLEEGWAVRFKK